MKSSRIIIIIGTIIMIVGIIFHLQGQSIVGPESSFMYSNPDWITYGNYLVITGGIILTIGIGMNFFKRN